MKKMRYSLVLFVVCMVLGVVFGCCTPKVEVVEKKEVKFENVYFDLNKAIIKDIDKVRLQEYAPLLKAMQGKKIILEGYCDARSSAKYNLILGQKRADAVAKYLVELGVPQEMIATVSYGIEKSSTITSGEAFWGESRRVQFVIR